MERKEEILWKKPRQHEAGVHIVWGFNGFQRRNRMSTGSSIRFAIIAVFVSLLCISVVQPRSVLAGAPQTSAVYAPPGCAPDDCNEVGFARLVRTPQGLSLNLHTTDLTPHNAYTVWFVVFNFPGACEDVPVAGCDPSDLFVENAMATVLWGNGHIVGGNGKGNFGAHLAVGDISGDTFPLELPGDGVGLINPMGAQVIIVVRSHGPKIPGLVDGQISMFNGVGCADLPPVDNPDACEDQQFAVFPSPLP
jgi:hypothetical protein